MPTYALTQYGIPTYGFVPAASVTDRMQRTLDAYQTPSNTIYADGGTMRNLVDALGAEFQAVRDALLGSRDQAFAASADWDLTDWEALVGVPTDATLTVGDRQSAVLARLAGHGATTLAQMRALARTYALGDVRLAVDAPASTVYVTFVNVLGVPPNLASLQAALEAALPARLNVVYLYQYLTVQQLTDTGRTVDQITADSLTVDQLAVSQASSL